MLTRAIFHMLINIWKSREHTVNTKVMVFNSNGKTVLLYGCETCRTTRKKQQKIQTFVNRCVRAIFRMRWLDKVPNEELWKRADQELIGKQIIVTRKWNLTGHNTSIRRQALTWNPQGKSIPTNISKSDIRTISSLVYPTPRRRPNIIFSYNQ